jgi:hypothetical protein
VAQNVVFYVAPLLNIVKEIVNDAVAEKRTDKLQCQVLALLNIKHQPISDPAGTERSGSSGMLDPDFPGCCGSLDE